ncbi:MAG TPA: leucyl aminopeptidase [bacterium]|nr:leucyl aminopeptidase [bacterium]
MPVFQAAAHFDRKSAPYTWVLFAFEKEKGFVNAPGKAGEAIREGLEAEGFMGREGQAALVTPPGGFFAKRVLALGLGAKEGVEVESFRRAGGRLGRKAREARVEEVSLDWPRAFDGERAKAFAEGALLGSYQYNLYKTQLKDAPKGLQKVWVKTAPGSLASLKSALKTAESYAAGAILARDLINGPPSDVTPKVLADMARKIAASNKNIRLKVYTKKDLKRMGAGGLLGVNIGSAQEPFLIHLHYKPASKPRKSVALVGKGITFDSGGLSLKPAGSMETMKMDMSGGAAVLGVFSQIAQFNPPVEVHGIVPTTENMPGGRAYKPGDVLKAMNGKTMEVLNTDAEGRLILSDGLSYAVRQKVDEIIDLATLTGACVVALGSLVSGALSNDPKLLARFTRATEAEGERIWEMPLVKEYREDIRSKVADIKNIGGGREAGTIIGGLFLQEFVGDTPWIHLDIAGPAYLEREYPALPYLTYGGTGLMVRSLLTYLRGA